MRQSATPCTQATPWMVACRREFVLSRTSAGSRGGARRSCFENKERPHMPSPFGAQAMSLGQLFADPSFIQVPPYQRSFAWTAEEAGLLLENVSEAMDAEGDSDQGGDYFLGP